MAADAETKQVAKRFSRDLMYSVAGLVCLNGITQIVVYPVLQSQMGAEAFGVVLSLISVISIMCCSFATAANYSRMVASSEDVKGDYNVFVLAISAVSVIVAVIAVIWVGWDGAIEFVGVAGLMVVTILRYYGDVDFRLSLNYKGFFTYYVIVSAGYCLGVGLLYLGSSALDLVQWWWVSLFIGEIASFIYVKHTGSIYQKPYFARSDHFKKHVQSILALSGAYLLSAIIMNADRLLLLAFVGATEVTIFYTASLVGKMIALFTSPLNGVIIGYLSKREQHITRGFVAKLSVVLLGVGAVLCVGTVVLSHVFILLLYPNLYEATKPLFVIACAGQTFYFLSETMLVILLKVAHERWQLYMNAIYAAVFMAVAVPCVILWQVWGIAWAIIIVNVFRFVMVSVFTFMRAGKPQDGSPMTAPRGMPEEAENESEGISAGNADSESRQR